MQTFHLPDVGEGLTEAELVSWRVQAGDTVEINGVIAEIETAKSVVELPSPYAGVVGELLAAEGDTIDVGAPIITIDPAKPADAAPGSGDGARGSSPAPAIEESSGSVLVGYGSVSEVPTRRRKPQREAIVKQAIGAFAKPPVRKLARDYGLDLADVRGSGPGGEVTRQDVVAHAEQASVFRNLSTPVAPAVREETVPLRPTITTGGQGHDEDRTEEIPVKGMRKATATGMVKSATETPHVSSWTDVDATRTMEFVQRLKASPDFADVRISPLLIMARAVIWAVRRTPMVNSAWANDDGKGAKILLRHYVNLGIAAATPRGLLVPNIKDAQDLSMHALAQALNQLTTTAREGKTTPDALKGGTITITNIGVFGLDAATPIINPGETGIIAMGAIRQKPWVVDGEVRPRWVTTVSGSFDHRVIDGDKIGRFIADVAAVLEEPALLLD